MSRKQVDFLVNATLYKTIAESVVGLVPSLTAHAAVAVAAPENFLFSPSSLAGMAAQRIVDVIESEQLTHSEESVSLVMTHEEMVRADVETLVISLARLAKVTDDTLKTKIAPVVEQMVTDTVMKAKAALSGENKIATVEVESFDWGMLADPIYLNTALTTCLDRAGVFRPDLTVREFYATECHNAAMEYRTENVTAEDAAAFAAAIEGLETPIAENAVILMTKRYMLGELRQVFTEGVNSTRPLDLVMAVKAATDAAKAADAVIEAAGAGRDIPKSVMENARTVSECVQLMFGAFQVHRELNHGKSFQLCADFTPEKTTLFMNNDLVAPYLEAGGSVEDLAAVGRYYTYRPTQNSKTTLARENFDAVLEKAKPAVEAFETEARRDVDVQETEAYGNAMMQIMRNKAVELRDARMATESLADSEILARRLKTEMTKNGTNTPMSDGFTRFLGKVVESPVMNKFYAALSAEFASQTPETLDSGRAYANAIVAFTTDAMTQM